MPTATANKRSWIYVPSFFSTTTTSKDEAAAATRLQAWWRARQAGRRYDDARAAAIKLQRAARSSYWDAWQQWEQPLSTMPGLVLERVTADKVRWAKTQPAEYEASPRPHKPLHALAAAALIVAFLAAVHVNPNEQPASKDAPPAVSQPSVVVLPGGAKVTLLSGWVANKTTEPSTPKDFWSGQPVRAVTLGSESKGLGSLTVVLSPAIENATKAVVEAGKEFVEHIRRLMKLLRQGVRSAARRLLKAVVTVGEFE